MQRRVPPRRLLRIVPHRRTHQRITILRYIRLISKVTHNIAHACQRRDVQHLVQHRDAKCHGPRVQPPRGGVGVVCAGHGVEGQLHCGGADDDDWDADTGFLHGVCPDNTHGWVVALVGDIYAADGDHRAGLLGGAGVDFCERSADCGGGCEIGLEEVGEG